MQISALLGFINAYLFMTADASEERAVQPVTDLQAQREGHGEPQLQQQEGVVVGVCDAVVVAQAAAHGGIPGGRWLLQVPVPGNDALGLWGWQASKVQGHAGGEG